MAIVAVDSVTARAVQAWPAGTAVAIVAGELVAGGVGYEGRNGENTLIVESVAGDAVLNDAWARPGDWLRAGDGSFALAAGVAEARAAELAAAVPGIGRAIDGEAELARLAFLTPGAGQMMEYSQTSSEVQAAAIVLAAQATGGPAPVAADYPMLKAELDAQIAAGVAPAPSFADIIGQVRAQSAAWEAPGAAIKEARRQGKIAAGLATAPAGQRAARDAAIGALRAIAAAAAGA